MSKALQHIEIDTGLGGCQDNASELGKTSLESFNRKVCPGCAVLKNNPQMCFV